jgi:hypothetical protein
VERRAIASALSYLDSDRLTEMHGTIEETTPQLMLRIMRDVNGQVFRLFGNKIIGGPFHGMIVPECNEYWNDGNGSVKLLGIYEHELHDVIDYATWRKPHLLINVGAAEGYYTIGLARNISDLQAYAFDIDSGCRALCQEFADKNGVAARVKVLDGCTSPEQMDVLDVREHKLYIIDCEGLELDLVDLERCRSIRNSDLIIECHDFCNPAISSTLADRLEETHKVVRILPKLPDYNSFPFVRQTPNIMSVLALTEKRPMPCCWLACWARRKKATI